MANDRIYIRCKACQEKMLLVKYFPAADKTDLFPTFGKLEEFIVKHLERCHPNWYCINLKGEPGLEFVTESDVPIKANIFDRVCCCKQPSDQWFVRCGVCGGEIPTGKKIK